MKASKRSRGHAPIICLEIGMFGLILLTLWLDEFIDLPHRLFNAAPTPYRVEEYIIETTSVLIVGIVTIVLTRILLKRLDRADEFVHICSWCRRVYLDDRWVDLEEYLLHTQDLTSSHGICENCSQKVQKELAAIKPKAKKR